MDPTPETLLPSKFPVMTPRTTGAEAAAVEDALEIDRVILSNSPRLYIREAWSVVEPSTTYLENWHIDLIAEHLEAVTAGEIKRLLINMPPRYMKSTCVSVMWPTWVWTRERMAGRPHNQALEGPGTKWVFASYADELRTKHSLDRRKLLQSEWYRARWPKGAELTSDQNVKTLFSNSSSGVMLATTMLGAGTGLGGNYIVIDDPHKTREEPQSKEVESQVAAYGDTFATRHDDKKQGVTVIVMQRINDNDLSAHVMKTIEEGYVHLKIEAEASEHRIIVFPRTGRIVTRNQGDLLWESREGPDEIRRQKAVMGRWKYAAQYQQDPLPEGGSIFLREWFMHRFHRDPRTDLPLGAKLRMVVQSWDTAAKKKEANDYWACTTWGLVVGEDVRIRMLDLVKERMEYTEGRQRVKDQWAKWKPTAVLIEDSSSGTAVISDLRTAGIPLLPISPAGSDKEANARAVSPMFESGMILLPEGADWADDYIESMTRFPKGQHDDDVDSTSQALNYLRRRQHGVMEYIEGELAKEKEKNLCDNPKCNKGEEGKRKTLGFNMEIVQAGAARYCSRFCAAQGSLR
jgi:predicted phage terminase large subunit-like protein